MPAAARTPCIEAFPFSYRPVGLSFNWAIVAPSIWARGTENPQNEASALARWAVAPAVEWEQEDDLGRKTGHARSGRPWPLNSTGRVTMSAHGFSERSIDNEADMHGVRWGQMEDL